MAKLSRKSAQLLLDHLREVGDQHLQPVDLKRAKRELFAIVQAAPRQGLVRRLRLRARSVEAKVAAEELADIRAFCFARAKGHCECGCGRAFAPFDPGELDHFFGRGRAESRETCWALSAYCHKRKTLLEPDAETWFRRYIEHAYLHSYEEQQQWAEARLAFVIARKQLAQGLLP